MEPYSESFKLQDVSLLAPKVDSPISTFGNFLENIVALGEVRGVSILELPISTMAD